jgi:mRNA-degrading endonuclease toxin of MazEF toxin-antitoxin module
MTEQQYARGTLVKGPDLLGPQKHRPYVCLSTDDPPFRDEEAVYAVVTTTRRSAAIPLAATDFTSGGLPRESYVNPWVLVTIKHADIQEIEGQLTEDTVGKIAQEAATHIGALD